MDTKLGIKCEKPPLDREKNVYVVSVNYKNGRKKKLRKWEACSCICIRRRGTASDSLDSIKKQIEKLEGIPQKHQCLVQGGKWKPTDGNDSTRSIKWGTELTGGNMLTNNIGFWVGGWLGVLAIPVGCRNASLMTPKLLTSRQLCMTTLCCYVVMLLCRYVVMLLCCCSGCDVVMLLCCYVMLLCSYAGLFKV